MRFSSTEVPTPSVPSSALISDVLDVSISGPKKTGQRSRNLSELALWASKDLSESVFGGKQNMSYWHTIFETGKTPSGVIVMPKGINLVEMIK